MFDMKQNPRKKRWSRHLFWVLSLTLIISMIPVTPAIAADAGTASSGNTTAVTQSNGTETSDSSDSSTASSDTGSSDTEKDSTSASSASDTNKTPAAAPRRAPAAARVTVTYNASNGNFTSGYKNTVTATVGSTVTLPTAKNVSLSGARLAGWSTGRWDKTPAYEPGAAYTVPSSDVKLYAVWQKTYTLAPNLEHMSGYYMVVDPAGTVQSEGKLEGPTQVTVTTSANVGEYFVNVFVKPDANYLITRLDTADVNNFIYPLGASYLGRPGSYLKEEDVKRMQDEGYVATFGWGSGYNSDGAKLYVNSQAFQPTPEAKITPDKTQNLNEGDVITMTVTLRAGDILNQYSAALSGTPVVHIGTGSGDSVADLPLSNVTSSGNDTYTGTVQYTLTAGDIARDKLSARVEATFNYSYKFPYKGEKGAAFTLDTTATIDSQSETVTINGYSTPHKVSYSYTYIGGVTPPDTIPTCPADSATYSKGRTVNIATSPAKGASVRDDANGGEWKFLGWFLYDKETSGTVTMGDDNLTFEGRWQFVADPDSLTYDANTNGEAYEGETEPSKGFVGNLVVVAKNAFSRIGYKFLHWNTQADGKGTSYLADVDRYKLTPGADILYAQWEKARHVTYALSYKGADGIDTSAYPTAITTVPQDAKDYYMNDSVTVSTDPAQRTVDDPNNHGTWAFEGWMNGTLAAGEKLTMGIDNIQLTGIWTFTPYDTLTYDGNGADSGSVATAEAASGTDVTVAENGFTRSGYRFTGWNTAKDGSGDTYKAGGSYTLKAGTDDVLYAQWEKARSVSYKLAYSGADKLDAGKYPAAVMKAPKDTKEYYKGDTVTVSPDPADRTIDDPNNHGTWTFGGWQTGGKDAGETVTVDAEDITLTGTWTFTPYDTLTYDGNGADSGSVATAEAASGTDVTVAENGFTRSGYRFIGWNTKAGGNGGEYKPGDSYTLYADSNDVLYAQWEKARSVSYKLDYSGADKLDADKYPAAVKKAPADTKEYYKGDTVTVSTDPADRTIDDPKNHGTWTFGGWQTGGKDAGKTVTVDAEDIALTGTWTFTPYDTLTYDGNGADSGSVATAEAASGKDVTVEKNGFSRSGYRFTGWNTAKDGSGDAYKAGDSYTLKAGTDDVLYAQWEKARSVSYKLTYSGADKLDADKYPAAVKKAPEDTKEYYKGDTVTVSTDPADRKIDDPDNHGTWTFGGWQTGGKDAGKTVTVDAEDITLTGIWTFTPYDTLTYDGNGADSGKVAGAEAPSGKDVTVEKNGFSRSGYRFTGWNTAKDGSGDAYKAGDSYTLKAGTDDVLYAQWEKARSVSYKLTYSGADKLDADKYPAAVKKAPEDTKEYYKGDTVTVSTDPVDRTIDDPDNHGTWTFGGWQTGGKDAGKTVTVDAEDITLTGIWTFTPYDTLTYDGNGANSGKVAGAEAPSGKGVTVEKNGFSRSGYRFTGWNTAKDGSGDAYKAGDSYTLKAGTDDVLYAQWEKARSVSYKLTYSGADKLDADKYPAAVKKAPEDTKEYYKGDTVTVSTDPVDRTIDDPDNHGTWTFGGWQTGGKDAGKAVTVDAEDITLTGTWTFTPYDTLTYDGNGADSGKVAGAEAPSGKDVTVEKNGFSRSGYRFTGWNTAKDGSGDAYKAGDSYTLKDGTDDVLYAQWEKNKTHKKGGADRHSSGGNPDTGDVTGLYGYVLLLVTCAAAGIVLFLIRRRRNADRTK